MGGVLATVGKYSEAIDAFKKTIAIKPDYSDAYSNIGNCYLYLKNHSNAIENFNNANFFAFNGLGSAYKELDKNNEAVINYRKAVNIKPDYLEAYENLGTTLSTIRQFDQAKEAFEKAINLSNKTAMSLSDKFCVDRHKSNFLDLVKNKLDLVFANEAEIMSLIGAKKFDEVILFGKQIKKHLIITRGGKGAVSINNNEIVEIDAKKDLNIVDLTGAGDLFASGYLHGFINNFSQRECLEKATEMSSKIIQQIGARL